MKTQFVRPAAVLIAAFLALSAPPAYARGHHGGSGGNFAPSAGRSSSGSMRGYTGGGLGGNAGKYNHISSSAGRSTYGSRANYGNRTGRTHYSNYSNQKAYRNYSAVNRSNRYAVQRNSTVRHNSNLHQQNRTTSRHLASTQDGRRHGQNWSQRNTNHQSRLDHRSADRMRNWDGHKSNYADARRNHQDHHNHHHDHDWWHNHCASIILWGGGYWGWYDGWWYPAWGYDPYYSYYAYDGPIYGYGGLAPDQVIVNVQSELQRLGYYNYGVDGIYGPLTQSALERYQQDNGLNITGAIDEDTLSRLGFA